MFKIERHYRGKTTYFIGDLCINGCQYWVAVDELRNKNRRFT